MTPEPDPNLIAYDRTVSRNAERLRGYADQIDGTAPVDAESVHALAEVIRTCARHVEETAFGPSYHWIVVPETDGDWEVALLAQIVAIMDRADVADRPRMAAWLADRYTPDVTS